VTLWESEVRLMLRV